MSLLNLDSKLSEKQRKGAYGSGLIGVGALLIAQAYGFVSPDQFDSIIKLVTVIGGTLGLGAATTAFDVLKGQQKNGAVIGDVALPTVEVPVPVPAELSTLEKITQAVEEVSALDRQVKNGLDELTQITGGLINVPGVLAMTPDLPGPLDDLVRGAGERYRK